MIDRVTCRSWRNALLASAFIFGFAVVPAIGSAVDLGSGTLAFVPAQNGDALSVIDVNAMRSVATIPLGGKPAGVAIAQAAGRAYVTSPDGPYLTVIDTAQRSVIGRIALSGGPLGVAVAPRGAPVYVADWYEHRVFVITPSAGGSADAGAGKLEATIPVGRSPSGLAVTPDGALLLSADRDDDQLSVIDTKARRVVATIKVGARPFGVTLSADGRRAYTANVGSNDVSIVDVAARRVIATVKVGDHPYAVALAKGRAFVTNQYAGTVSVFDVGSHAVLATITVGDYPEGIEASADQRHVYVANWESNTVSRIDAETLEVTGSAATADGPRGFGNFLWQPPKR